VFRNPYFSAGESGRKAKTVGTEVPIPACLGTHPLGWAENDKQFEQVGTKVPIPACLGTRTLVRALCL